MPSKSDPVPMVFGQPGPPQAVSKATAYNIHISTVETPGQTHVDGLRQASADRTSELLMLNHAKYHTLFDYVGFHNHTVHHLLTLFALGASPSEIQAAYDLNKHYQLVITDRHAASTSIKLKDPSFFNDCLGKPDFYADYLRFFQDEITEHGVPHVVNEYMLKGDDRANSVLVRMYSGFLHPIIHLGFALEFHQPCLVAESLAAACIHDDWPALFLLPAEDYLKSHPETPSSTLHEIVVNLRNDPIMRDAVRPADPLNKIKDGLLYRVSEELLPYLARFQVDESDEANIARRAAETCHMSSYICGAAQNPRKVEAIDFVMMHMTTLSIFYPKVFMKQDWISNKDKKRLLEFKGRSDAAMYAGSGCPQLYPERITKYIPKQPSDGWPQIIQRANKYGDDGHTSKLIRSLFNAKEVSEPYYGTPGFPLEAEGFLSIAHIVMDSVERMLDPGYFQETEKVKQFAAEGKGQDAEVVAVIVRWVRWCGMAGAWDDYPDLVRNDAKVADGVVV